MLADDQCGHDLDTPVPIMMLAAEGDVPREQTPKLTTPNYVPTHKAEKMADGSIKLNMIQHYAPRTVKRTAMKTELMDKLKAQRAGGCTPAPPESKGMNLSLIHI